MLKKLRRAIHNEQSQPEPVRARQFKAMKRLEDIPQAFGRSTDARVVNLDANHRPEATASKKNLTA